MLQFGVREVVLIGFDMEPTGGRIHFHEDHQKPLGNPSVGAIENWRKWFDGEAQALVTRGVKVWNCSASSALTAYERIPIDALLDRWSEKN